MGLECFGTRTGSVKTGTRTPGAAALRVGNRAFMAQIDIVIEETKILKH